MPEGLILKKAFEQFRYFIDAWIIEFAKDNSIDTIYSFDKKHFKGLNDIVVKQPFKNGDRFI